MKMKSLVYNKFMNVLYKDIIIFFLFGFGLYMYYG